MQKNIRNVSIFLSSPGDVLQERQIAFKVINKLNLSPFLHGKINLEIVSWDKPDAGIPLIASLSPQEAINQGLKMPSDCDIVIVILWSRFGTPLTKSAFQKPDSKQYLSGTEWEFLSAQEKARQSGKPLILLYRRTEKVLLDPDIADFKEKIEQRQRVNDFFKSLLNPDGSIQYGYSSYLTPEEFESLLEQNIVALVARLMDNGELTPQPLLIDEIWRASQPIMRFRLSISQPNTMDRTVFIVPSSEIIFGMAKRAKYPDVDIVIRLLPSRSPKLDPANWETSSKISKAHWRLRVIDRQVQLMDISKNGIMIDRTFLNESELESLGDIVELYGTAPEEDKPAFIRINKDDWLTIPDRLNLTLGENLIGMKTEVFHDPVSKKIDAVLISRLTNYPQHQYLQLIHRVSIGNSPECAVYVDAPKKDKVFGELLLNDGLIYVSSFSENTFSLNGTDLVPGMPTQLKEEDNLKLGIVTLFFDKAVDEHFLGEI